MPAQHAWAAGTLRPAPASEVVAADPMWLSLILSWKTRPLRLQLTSGSLRAPGQCQGVRRSRTGSEGLCDGQVWGSTRSSGCGFRGHSSLTLHSFPLFPSTWTYLDLLKPGLLGCRPWLRLGVWVDSAVYKIALFCGRLWLEALPAQSSTPSRIHPM